MKTSYSSTNIRHQRNIAIMMVISPLVTLGLVAVAIIFTNNNVPSSAQVVCNKTISSGSISSAANSLSSGQSLCLDGTFNQSVSITKSGVSITSVPGKTARINGGFEIKSGANNVKVMNLYLNGNGTIVSPHILGNGAYFYGNQITNQGAARGICFAIGETDVGIEVQGITIDSNRIFQCGTVYHDQGIYAEYVRNAVIRNNYIYDNPDFGIQFYPSAQNSIFENNLLDNNKRGLTFSSEARNINKTSSGNIVRNNIITNSPDAYNLNYYWGGPAGTGNKAEGNCLFGGGKGNIQPGLSGYITVSGTIEANPMYVDRAVKDFRLKSGSPCAGKGPQSSPSSNPPSPQPPSPSPLPPPTPPPTPSQPPSNTTGPVGNYFGKNTVGGDWTSMSADAKRGSRYFYSGPPDQQMYQVGGFIRGSATATGSQVVNVAVYSDKNGEPGELLAKGITGRNISGGQSSTRLDFTLQSPVSLIPGSAYWLMFISGQSPGVAEYSHTSSNTALRWQAEGSDLYSDGPSTPAGTMNSDNKAAVIWGLYRPTSSNSDSGSSSGHPTPPPVTVPGSNPSTPVSIPSELPVQSDGSLIADFNGDGSNDIAKDTNNDGKIDPLTEIVIDGTTDSTLTDTSKEPISAADYGKFLQNSLINNDSSNSGAITFKVGPLPEVAIAKPVAYTFLIAQGAVITGVSAYLAITKLSILAGIRARLGL